MADDDRHELVADALAEELTIAEAADRFGLTQVAVQAIFAEETRRCYDSRASRGSWALGARRMEVLERKFYRKAVDELDATAAVVAIKANERRASVSGANQAIAHAVHLMVAPPEYKNSTEQLSETMDRFLGIGPRERLLENKELHREDMTLEEIDELEAFRAEREARDDAKREKDRRERAERLAARKGNGGLIA